jgi:membrane protein implicated in regulation of membrane protease activity
MPEFGKILVLIGLLLAAAGVLLWAGVGRGWVGHLPGDIHYTKGNSSFYFPLTTCLLASVLLSLLLWLLRKF